MTSTLGPPSSVGLNARISPHGDEIERNKWFELWSSMDVRYDLL